MLFSNRLEARPFSSAHPVMAPAKVLLRIDVVSTADGGRSVVVDVVDQVVLYQAVGGGSLVVDRVTSGVVDDVVADRHVVGVVDVHRRVGSATVGLIGDLEPVDHQVAGSDHVERLASGVGAVDHDHTVGQIGDRVRRGSRSSPGSPSPDRYPAAPAPCRLPPSSKPPVESSATPRPDCSTSQYSHQTHRCARNT